MVVLRRNSWQFGLLCRMAKNCDFTDGSEVELSSLAPEIQELCKRSIEAQKFAYSPYSKFKVGAALLTESNKVYTGCNVENISYGMTICAERTALVKAISEGELKFKAIAVTGTNEDEFTTPCGACRQFLVEFGSNIAVFLPKANLSLVKVSSSKGLLPYSFESSVIS